MPRRLTAEARRTSDGTFADEEPSEGSAAAAAVAFDFDEEERDEGGGGELRCATLNGLVRRLTHHSIREAHFLDAFLLTYRSFTTPLELLALLKSRFAVPMPHGLVPAERLRYQRMIVEPIRHRVVNVLRHWVTHHFDDFEAEHEHAKEGERIEAAALQRAFLAFVDGAIKDNPKTEHQAIALRNKMERRVLGAEDRRGQGARSDRPPPPPLPPKKASTASARAPSLLDYDPTEVARQLSLIESHLFQQISPKECLGQAWNKKNKEERAPNIVELTKRFNQVSNWVATEILREEKLAARAKVLKRFIKVAAACREINSFNAVQEIVAALNSASVYRLKLTWGQLKGKTEELWRRTQESLSKEANWKKFREVLAQCDPPCIPYLGIFLSDLTFIEEGNPDSIVMEGVETINFVKRRKVADVIAKIQTYQVPYNFVPVKELQDLLITGMTTAWGEDELYKRSLVVGPRQKT